MSLPTAGDRAAETSTTTGTVTYSLAGAISGWRTIVAACGDGATVDYYARDQAGGSDFEVGRGVITDATPDTLTRATIHTSSNGGAAVNWAAGTREIVVAFTAKAFRELAYSPVTDITTATLNLSLTHANNFLRCTNAAGCNITVQAQATVAWEADTEIHGYSTSGITTLTQDTGVTIVVPSGFNKEVTQNSAWTLKRVASDTWVLSGHLVVTP